VTSRAEHFCDAFACAVCNCSAAAVSAVSIFARSSANFDSLSLSSSADLRSPTTRGEDLVRAPNFTCKGQRLG
jgi:hypothetical protein